MINYKQILQVSLRSLIIISLVFCGFHCTKPTPGILNLHKDSRIVLIGNNLAARMGEMGHFETELHLRYPDSNLFIRNMGDGGNTPGFRPHASRNSPWAFPGAEAFQTEFAAPTGSQGHFPSEDEWLEQLRPDFIIAFFGYGESFAGPEGLDNFKAELEAFIKHTQSQRYGRESASELVIVSPIAFQDLSDRFDLPDGEQENKNLALYAQAMEEVSRQAGAHFIDAFTPTKKWFSSSHALTIDGFQLTSEGDEKFSEYLVDKLFGKTKARAAARRSEVLSAVKEKSWMWLKDFKIPNGVHAYGRRFNPFGPDNYPAEVEKTRQLTLIRDTAIWRAARGEAYDVAAADLNTLELPEVKTNYTGPGEASYLYGEEALKTIHTAPGFKVELFASEEDFPDLENPVQLTFDNKGRLWVAVMPTYPHWRPGDPKPNDKLIILEDTDGDGKADKQTTFADGLHLPIGFELTAEGVYLSQGTNMVLLRDTDGDGKADETEILLSGFDDHDTHHAHSVYTGDPSGAIYMGEGVFLHTDVETPYGVVRASNGGFYRYSPQLRKLERVAQLSIPNPWGIAFDDWGQTLFAETSGPAVRWMLPGSILPRYGEANDKGKDLVPQDHQVRPTSGLEFVSSRHFPDEMQGDYLINNTIGFLGTKQHTLVEDGTGYKSEHRQDLLWSDDPNFRPVAMEFAPDGSLYIADWHNVLIGHMQHNARDPLRDHVHGRIYRVTYPSRPLVSPAKIDGASIEELLDNLKLPEYRSRYRSRAELRGRKREEVLKAIKSWTEKLDPQQSGYEHHLLEALWVSWGMDAVDQPLLRKLLKAQDHRVRAAAVQVLRYVGHQVSDQKDLLIQAARDEHGRVRLAAIVAASWLEREAGMEVLKEAEKKPLDEWMEPAFKGAVAHLSGHGVGKQEAQKMETSLTGADKALYVKGAAIFAQDGFCQTCHQADGMGLEASGFPPLKGSRWVQGDEERLIKLTLKGLSGPIEVLGKRYPGQVPMTPFGGMLNDEEVASVLTYVRNAFGNSGSVISAEKVKAVRASIEDKSGFYTPEELLKEHPMEKN